jgi:hypothetical protein
MSQIVLAVVGTRTLGCRGDQQRAALRITWSISKLCPDVVISGGAKGVDSIAERVALDMGYSEDDGTLRLYRPTVHQFHGPGGYRERDALIAANCTHLLRIHCILALSYGSGWTADEARRLGRTVVQAEPCWTDLKRGRLYV